MSGIGISYMNIFEIICKKSDKRLILYTGEIVFVTSNFHWRYKYNAETQFQKETHNIW